MRDRESNPAFLGVRRRRYELLESLRDRLPEQKYESARQLIDNYEPNSAFAFVAWAIVNLNLEITPEEKRFCLSSAAQQTIGPPNSGAPERRHFER